MNFLGRFNRTVLRHQISSKSVEWNSCCYMRADGQTDRQTDIHKEGNSRFSNFANAPKKKTNKWLANSVRYFRHLYTRPPIRSGSAVWESLVMNLLSVSKKANSGGRAVSGVGTWPLACWNHGFESRRWHGLCVVWCQIEAFRTGRSLVQSIPTECVFVGVCVCLSLSVIKYNSNTLRCVHTNRVELSLIQSVQTLKGVAVTLWRTYNGSRGSAYTPAESSRVTRVLPGQESWCRMFHFRQSDSSDRSWRRIGCRKAYFLVKDHEAIYEVSCCEHRNRVLHWWWCS